MKNTIAILLLLACTSLTFAQETVVFATKSKEKSTSKSRSAGSTEMNIIKIAPLSFISGFVPLFFERSINDYFSIQAGVGVTTKNYVRDALYEAGGNSGNGNGGSSSYRFKSITWNNGATSNTFNINNIYGGTARKSTIGYMISLEPRLYFASEGLEGGFMGLNLSKKRNNYTSNTIKTGNSSSGIIYDGGTVKEFDNLSSLLVNFGNQRLYDHLSLEYSAGIGIRSIKGEHYVYGQDFGTNKYVSGIGYLNVNKVAYDLSIKLGYHF